MSAALPTNTSAFVSLVYTSWGRFEEYTRDTVEHLIILIAVYVVLCVGSYWAIVYYGGFQRGLKSPKRVLVITAHPDDECMFFGPTILNLVRREARVYIMCLSTGENYGMGKTRKKELYEACNTLGVEEGDITIVNHTTLPDDMLAQWPIEVIACLISHHIEANSIDTIVTFDKHGVSYHRNHCSIYYAIAHLSVLNQLPKDCVVYVLETVNVLRKYWLFLDIPVSYILSRTRYLVNYEDREIIHKAMKQHRSQLLWFRRLYMHFSRYMFINSLQQMNRSDIELDLEVDE